MSKIVIKYLVGTLLLLPSSLLLSEHVSQTGRCAMKRQNQLKTFRNRKHQQVGIAYESKDQEVKKVLRAPNRRERDSKKEKEMLRLKHTLPHARQHEKKEAGSKESKQAQELYKNASEKARESYNAGTEAVSKAALATKLKAKKTYNDASEKVKDAYDATAEKISDAADTTKQKAKQVYKGVAEKAQSASEKVKDAYDATAEKISDAADTTKQKAKQVYKGVAEKAQSAAEKVGDAAQTVKEKVKEGYHDASGKAYHALEVTADKVSEAAEATKKKAKEKELEHKNK